LYSPCDPLNRNNLFYYISFIWIQQQRQWRNSKQHIILVSDGDATAPHPSPARFAIQEAAKTIRKGITISCICINEENADPDLMHRIARIGRGRMTVIENTKGIRDAFVEERSVAGSG